MSSVPTQDTFRQIYAGQAPWDIPKAQKVFVDAVDQITGDVLDAGCGTGENALFLASRGRQVTGIDFLEEPIARVRRKVIERGTWATFLVKDALTLARWGERFDSVIDSGLFHVFKDTDRQLYVDGLATILKPGGRLFLMCFSDEEPGTQGPRRVSRKELNEAFAHGWSIDAIHPARFETRSDLQGFSFSEGGPKAWFVIVRRVAAAPEIQSVVETVVYADDLAKMEAFYTGVLGLSVIGKEKDRHVFFRAGSGNVFLVFKAETTLRCETLPTHGATGPSHFAFGIDVEAYEPWRQHLTSKGVNIEREIHWPLGGKSLYFRDPANNLGELITPSVWGTPVGW
jgi:SAM-dependent methyltransferase